MKQQNLSVFIHPLFLFCLSLLLLEEYRAHQMKKKKGYYRKKLLKKFERKIVKKLRK